MPTTLPEAIKTLLSADTELMTYLPGGVFDENSTGIGPDGLTPSNIPRAANNINIKPSAFIRWREDNPDGPHFTGEARFFVITFYEDSGSINIDKAKRRCKDLLHLKQVTVDGQGINMITYAGGMGSYPAADLMNASANSSRYRVAYTRR